MTHNMIWVSDNPASTQKLKDIKREYRDDLVEYFDERKVKDIIKIIEFEEQYEKRLAQ